MKRPTFRGVTALATYATAIVAANVATAHFGLVPVLPGLVVTAGTYAAGAALLARDVAQDAAGAWATALAVLVGAVLSAALAGPRLAVASGLAFLLSEALDMMIYTPLRRRGWTRAVLASNTAGALVDTLAFLTLAAFPVTAASVSGQLAGKLLWATCVPVAVRHLVVRLAR